MLPAAPPRPGLHTGPAAAAHTSLRCCEPSDEGTERGGEGGIGGKGYTPTARVVAWPARGAEGAKAAAVPATAATMTDLYMAAKRKAPEARTREKD